MNFVLESDEYTCLIRTSYHVPKFFRYRTLQLVLWYCGKWRKISKSCHDLDLDRTMPNIEHVQDIFILYYNIFKFQVPRSIIFGLSCLQTHKQRHTHTQPHNDEYSITAVDKPQL